MSRDKLIGEILIEMGCVNQDQVNAALEQQINDNSERIGEILVASGACSAADITAALAEQFDMEMVDLAGIRIDPQVLHLVPKEQCQTSHIIPVELADGVLRIAIADPFDLEALDAVRFALSETVEAVLAPREAIDTAISRCYAEEQPTKDAPSTTEPDDGTIQFVNIDDRKKESYDSEKQSDEAPVIKLVSIIIAQAVTSRASDIHIEPMLDRLRIRYRIDGNCYEMDSPPKRLQGAIIARLKIMASMNMAEKRRPQDGKIPARFGGRHFDLRVSTLPAAHGESVVLRILDKSALGFGLDHLGFHADDIKRFKALIRKPNGIILITGPTGSGKTTTLYSALKELNTPDRKIITVENPVEYTMHGINQVQVNDAAGMTFQRALKAMLRQAPNVILVGEIRDSESAHIAIEAALTGHLVFATLHTCDAPSALTRLIELKIAPFLVSSSVQAVQAQRLVRMICKDCKVPAATDLVRMQGLGLRQDQVSGRTLYRGEGCVTCRNTGFKGRKGIYEIMTMNQRMRELCFKRAPTDTLRVQARRDGMTTLLEDGIRKALEGWTTVDEVLAEASARE
jgi:type IV pilus assembly protein PilB